MRVKYTLDHSLLELETLCNLKGHDRLATWIALSMIIHFTKSKAGSCRFIQNQMYLDTGIRKQYWKKAIDFLIQLGYISMIKAYSRSTNEAAVYRFIAIKGWAPGAPGWGTRAPGIGHQSTRDGAPGAQERYNQGYIQTEPMVFRQDQGSLYEKEGLQAPLPKLKQIQPSYIQKTNMKL